MIEPILRPLPKFVRVVVKKGDTYLMVFQESLQRYVQVGGKKELSEEWAEAAIREFHEETGAELIECELITEKVFLLKNPTDLKPIQWLGRFYHAISTKGKFAVQEPEKHSDMHFIYLRYSPSDFNWPYHVENPENLTIHRMVLQLVPKFAQLPDTVMD